MSADVVRSTRKPKSCQHHMLYHRIAMEFNKEAEDIPNGPTSRRCVGRGHALQRGRFLPKALHAMARISARLTQEPKEDGKAWGGSAPLDPGPCLSAWGISSAPLLRLPFPSSLD